jgi:hypothetical protein
MRLFGGAPVRRGLVFELRSWISVVPPAKASERAPVMLVDNTSPPKWEAGQLKVYEPHFFPPCAHDARSRLKPQFRLSARKLRFAVNLAESLGYIVLRNTPRVEPAVYPPRMKGQRKEFNRLKQRKLKIDKAMEGMDKRRDAMHKKDREERRTTKLKGIDKFFPDRRSAPLPKGNTHYKRRRAIGNG